MVSSSREKQKKKAHTEQSTTGKPSNVAAERTLFSSFNVIGISCFDEYFLSHVEKVCPYSRGFFKP